MDNRIKIHRNPQGLSFQEFHELDSHCFPKEPVQPDTFRRYMEDDLWAAWMGNELVGYCNLIHKPEIAWLARIGVRRDCRGLGIGRNLMKTAISRCRQLGYSAVILYVKKDNAPALALYRSLGFMIEETAWQYILHQPSSMTASADSSVTAVPLPDVEVAARPEFPPDWSDIDSMHRPPQQHVLVFQDSSGATLGYCRLSPDFPGCFPFRLADPERHLLPALRSMNGLLNPAKDHLKLTINAEPVSRACSRMNMELNYTLYRMRLSGLQA